MISLSPLLNKEQEEREGGGGGEISSTTAIESKDLPF